MKTKTDIIQDKSYNTLDDIIRHFFGVKCVFKKTDGNLTKEGSKAYGKLTELLYSVGNLTNTDMNNVVETLDIIVNSPF